jgi:hypothetical protein
VLRDFVEVHVTVINLDEKLHGALQPDMQAAQARRLNDDAVIQVTQSRVFEPRHQKSSAEGMRL